MPCVHGRMGLAWERDGEPVPKRGQTPKTFSTPIYSIQGPWGPCGSSSPIPVTQGKAALSNSGCLCGFSPFYPHFLFCLSTSRAQMYTLFMLPQKLFYKHVLYQTSTFLGSQPAFCELSQEIQWAKDLISSQGTAAISAALCNTILQFGRDEGDTGGDAALKGVGFF